MPKPRQPTLTWIALGLGLAWWWLQAALEAWVFQPGGSFFGALTCYGRPEAIGARALAPLLFLWLGIAGDRAREQASREREHSGEVKRVVRYLDAVRARLADADSSSPVLDGAASPLPADVSPEVRVLDRAARRLTRQVEERLGQFQALLDVSEAMSAENALDAALGQLHDGLAELLPFDRLGVALIDEDATTVRTVWARCAYGPTAIDVGFQARLADTSLGRVLASGEPRIINDLAAWLAGHPDSRSTRLLVEEGVRSSLTCPLVVGGRAVGFVFFSSRRVGAWSTRHGELFKLLAGQVAAIVERAQQYERLARERERSRELLLNVVPERILWRVERGEFDVVERLPDVGVVIADIVGFTAIAAEHPPEAVLDMLRAVFGTLDALAERHGIEKIKTIGDAYMAVVMADERGGLASLADFAVELAAAVGEVRDPAGRPVQVRVGLAVGPVIAGVVGQAKFAYDVWGDTVNVASRLEGLGLPGRVQVSEAAARRLRATHVLVERGEIRARGRGPLRAFLLQGRREAASAR